MNLCENLDVATILINFEHCLTDHPLKFIDYLANKRDGAKYETIYFGGLLVVHKGISQKTL